MQSIDIKIKCLENYCSKELPRYATAGSAGIDLIAAIENAIVLEPSNRMLIPNGIKIHIPEGYEAQVRSRSGLALNSGITVLNSPGTIDSDYRGEIATILLNTGVAEFVVEPGSRISQMVISPVVKANLVQVDELSETTERGGDGFGSTGM